MKCIFSVIFYNIFITLTFLKYLNYYEKRFLKIYSQKVNDDYF